MPINIPNCKNQEKAGAFLLEFIQNLIVSLILFFFISNFLVQTRTVLNISMQPNFYEGDRIITDVLSYRFREPARGEIIVLKYPKDESIEYLKRVIGLPGEEILIQNHSVKIFNEQHPKGFFIEEEYLAEAITTEGGSFLPEGVRVKIPADSYFVMGDNRGRSSDSRSWGLVPEKDVVGRVLCRYWPLIRMEAFAAVDYKE